MTVSAAASPYGGGGSGALMGPFFVTARLALILVTRFFGAVLAATRLAILVRAARLGALPAREWLLRPAGQGPWPMHFGIRDPEERFPHSKCGVLPLDEGARQWD
jgi:hypothetical protein